MYVDDIIFGSNEEDMSQSFGLVMQKEFEMSMLGNLTYFLGLQISQQDKGIFIHQTKYIKEMLKKFQMEDCKPILTPMVTGCKLSLEDSSKDVDQRLYRSMIGSLLYVIASRLDVMQVVRQVAQLRLAPKEFHIIVIKGILRYLKGIAEHGLWYPKGNDLVIQTYTYAYWVGSVDDRKSTSGASFYSTRDLE